MLKTLAAIAWSFSATAMALACNPLPPHIGKGGGPTAAPEIDPSTAIAALTLLTGGIAVIRSRRKK
ncbi:MAG TPA: hypothetical protein VME21_13045 [Steroidobacteraceae bacterium]|nr:hypothetical protein [Steroidobacteraceae bacterium]